MKGKLLSQLTGKKGPLFRRMVLLVFFGAVLGVYAGLVSYGNWDLVQNENRGDTFDTLGRSLLKGEATVAVEAINSEAYVVDGKIYTYFGPFPALIRIVWNAAVPAFYRQWSRIACLGAAFLAVLAFAGCLGRIRRFNPAWQNRPGTCVFGASLLGFAFASPLVFLVSCGYIYHESILWAFAGSVASLYFFTGLLWAPKARAGLLCGLGISAAAAFLSRPTFGAPWFIIVVLLTVQAVWRRVNKPSRTRREKQWGLRHYLCLLIPVILALGFYGWYNQERFGSPFLFVDYSRYHIFNTNLADREHVFRSGIFNIRRFGPGVMNYFAPMAENFSVSFPFFHLIPAHHFTEDLYITHYREWVLALPLAASWLVFGAFMGVFGLIRKRVPVMAGIGVLAFVPQWISILTFYFVTHRYSADFYPLLLYLYVIFLGYQPVPGKGGGRTGIAALLLLLAIVSSCVTVLSTLSWNARQNWASPYSWKQSLQQGFEAANLKLSLEKR